MFKRPAFLNRIFILIAMFLYFYRQALAFHSIHMLNASAIEIVEAQSLFSLYQRYILRQLPPQLSNHFRYYLYCVCAFSQIKQEKHKYLHRTRTSTTTTKQHKKEYLKTK